KVFVDLDREFLDTNGAVSKAEVRVTKPTLANPFEVKEISNKKEALINTVKDLNIASQQGLIEMFDASIGQTTVLMPFGGKYQLSQAESSVQKISVRKADTDTVTILAHG
ncbi:hypothetical protein IR145_11905, partial [Streptococcus danieliae]|nr:hypothetical protein [Streptococcus danieliae]